MSSRNSSTSDPASQASSCRDAVGRVGSERKGRVGPPGQDGARGATPDVMAAIAVLCAELDRRDAGSWTEAELTQHYSCEILIRASDPTACAQFGAYLDRSRASVGDRAAILSEMVRGGVLTPKHPRFSAPLLRDPMWDTVDAVVDAFVQARLPAPEWYVRRYQAVLAAAPSSVCATPKPPDVPPAT